MLAVAWVAIADGPMADTLLEALSDTPARQRERRWEQVMAKQDRAEIIVVNRSGE